MANLTGNELAQNIRRRIDEMKMVCREIDEDTAGQSPAGRWSPKEIISHLLGPEGTDQIKSLQAFLDQDTPKLDIEAENPFFSQSRAQSSFARLFSEFEDAYQQVASFAAGLAGEELDRKAQIPMLKETPYGEYPTLETWLDLIGGERGSHLQFHINHMREILQELEGAAS